VGSDDGEQVGGAVSEVRTCGNLGWGPATQTPTNSTASESRHCHEVTQLWECEANSRHLQYSRSRIMPYCLSTTICSPYISGLQTASRRIRRHVLLSDILIDSDD
jgi:hypothetical protein